MARDPTCLARSLRDPRLCSAALESDRGACQALVTGDAKLCGSDRVCARQTKRWSSVLERPNAKSDFITMGRAEITVDGQPPSTVDLSSVAAMGAVLRRVGEKMQLVIGRPRTARWPKPEDPWATPQLFIELTVPRTALPGAPAGPSAAAAKGSPAPVDLGMGELTFELLAPSVASLSGVTATVRRVTVEQLTPVVGAPAVLELQVELTQAPHTYAVALRLQTFVRESPAPTASGGEGPIVRGNAP